MATQQTPKPPRRSARLTTYQSNGREALAQTIGWTREKLEIWIMSPTVRPHLQHWYRLCVDGERRFNEAAEWINSGEQGYYYHPEGLEEDLLLSCLGEGNVDDEMSEQEITKSDYVNDDAQTGGWVTQELWARTAWRIIQDNTGELCDVQTHPSRFYAWVIDLLCLAFHSIAYRGNRSCYYSLIGGYSKVEKYKWETGKDEWFLLHGGNDAVAEGVTQVDDPMELEENQASETTESSASEETAFNSEDSTISETNTEKLSSFLKAPRQETSGEFVAGWIAAQQRERSAGDLDSHDVDGSSPRDSAMGESPGSDESEATTVRLPQETSIVSEDGAKLQKPGGKAIDDDTFLLTPPKSERRGLAHD